ncbi:MAG TPA: ABC transporter substrate-binding protein [Xanthobacteraceae bacterium]|nr:ABC transporter substrate-binding protein [Xanthobacteraceae bacterium]
MLTRRQFGKGAAAVAAGALMAPAVARAQLQAMRCGLASGVNDAQVAFQTIGMHKRLHWYQDDGIELKIVNSTNTSLPLQMLSNAQVEFATTSAYNIIPAYADHPELGLISAYTWMPRVHNQTAVKPDSPIKDIKELKGKTIGIRSTGDSGFFFLQGVFAQMGIDPKNDVNWVTVGAGGPAGRALHNGSVDALAIWDVEFFRIGVAGFPVRVLPNPPVAKELFGNTYLVNRQEFAKRKELYGKMFRSIAKGQIFTALNPRAAVLLHWDLYPESKLKGKSDAEQLEDMIKLLEVRRDKWFPQPDSKDQRMGVATPEQWKASEKFAEGFAPQMKGKIKDLSKLYTLDIIDEANKFDRKAFEEFARNFKY